MDVGEERVVCMKTYTIVSSEQIGQETQDGRTVSSESFPTHTPDSELGQDQSYDPIADW